MSFPPFISAESQISTRFSPNTKDSVAEKKKNSDNLTGEPVGLSLISVSLSARFALELEPMINHLDLLECTRTQMEPCTENNVWINYMEQGQI